MRGSLDPLSENLPFSDFTMTDFRDRWSRRFPVFFSRERLERALCAFFSAEFIITGIGIQSDFPSSMEIDIQEKFSGFLGGIGTPKTAPSLLDARRNPSEASGIAQEGLEPPKNSNGSQKREHSRIASAHAYAAFLMARLAASSGDVDCEKIWLRRAEAFDPEGFGTGSGSCLPAEKKRTGSQRSSGEQQKKKGGRTGENIRPPLIYY